MNYFSGLNLSPEAAAYAARTIGEEPPPAPDMQAPDGGAPPPDASFWDVVSGKRARDVIKGGMSPEAYAALMPLDSASERLQAPAPAATAEPAPAHVSEPAGDDGFPDYRDPSTIPQQAIQSASPGVYVAPHWQGSARSEKVERGIDPNALMPGREHRELAAVDRVRAADATYEASRLETDAEDQIARAGVVAEEQAVAARNALAQRRDAYVQSQQQQLETLSHRAQKEIDPDDFWKARGGAGGQVFAALAVALGQFGASLTGGQNTAWQIIQSGIDDNIRAQQKNVENAGAAHDRARNLYERNLAAIGDPQQAYLATKTQYLDQVRTMLGEQYARARGKKDEAAYQTMLASIQDERAKAADEFGKLSADRFTLEFSERFHTGGMVGGAGGKDRSALYVPTLGGYARDVDTAKKLNDQGAMRMQINADLHRISQLLEESKGLSTVGDYGRMQEIRTEIASLKAGVLQRTTVLSGQGAMSEGDKAVSEARSALSDVDPRGATDASIARMQKALVRVATTHQRDHKLAGQASGIQIGGESYRKTPHGIEPVSELAGTTKPLTKTTQSFEDDRQAVRGVAR